MNKIRIVFMGTPDFAVTILKGLLDQDHEIVGVITAPDRPAGRGRKVNQSAVKKFALSQNLKVLQPTNLKNEIFLEELETLQATLQIVVAFRMLPKQVWNMPKYGTFNLHASLLPQYRGAAPINWAIINGEEKTGVTTFFIDDKIDTGEIILQTEIDIELDETLGSLHDRLMHLGAKVVNQTVDLIANGNVKTTKQTEIELKIAPKIHTTTCEINWESSLSAIYNMIRGLNPYPAAWSTLENGDEKTQVKLYDVQMERGTHSFPTGSVIKSKKELKIAVNEGFLIIDSLKIAGKRKMDSKSLLNGYTFSENSKML